jgi:DNA-binding GntR family transcriptional regulator
MPDIHVRRESTADQIAKGLEAMILNGQLAPGQPIKEAPLATRLGVSRNTVREAIRVLSQSGLVRHEMHRGAIPREPSVREVRELYDIRLIVEPVAVSKLKLPAGLDPLRSAIEDLKRAAATGDVNQVVAGDLGFHLALVTTLGNERLTQFFGEVTNQLRFYVATLSRAEPEQQKPTTIVEEHEAIVTALERKSRAEARRLTIEHIRENAARVTAIVRAREPSIGH